MTNLEQLLRERVALESRMKELEQSSRQAAILQAKKIIHDFSLDPYDLFDEISIRVEPRYENPTTGEKWSGRGKTPNWLKGKDRSQYEIKKP
jgi:DNA-binding protein H-NS